MVLSYPDLLRAHQYRRIRFEPDIDRTQFRQASIDLRLGYKISKPKPLRLGEIDARKLPTAVASDEFWNEEKLEHKNSLGKRQDFVIEPDEYLVAETLEHVYIPYHLAAFVEGRSGFARAGLSIHQTAPLLNPGWHGQIKLEMVNSGPWKIRMTPKDVLICTVIFFELKTRLEKGEGYGDRKEDKFQGTNSASPADDNAS